MCVCMYISHGLCVLMCECGHAHTTLCMWRLQDILNCRSSLSTSFEIGTLLPAPPQLHMPRLAGPWTYKDSSVFTSHTPAGALGLQKQTCIQFYMQKQNKTKNLQFYLICVFCGRNNSTISKFYIYSIWGCWNPGFSLQERKIQMWNKGRILKCCVSIG